MKKNLLFLLIFSITSLFSLVVVADSKRQPSYQASKAQQALFLAITKNTTGRYVAVGEHGLILFSDDEGVSWSQAEVPVSITLTGVAFVNEKTVVAVGHDALILRSTDAAQTWQEVHYEPELEQSFLNLSFFDENNGVAVGAYGLYFQTLDGGESWESIYFETLDDPEFGLPHFYAINAIAEQQLVIIGEVGFIGKSEDGGESWQREESPYKGSFFNHFVTGDKQFVTGLRGHIFSRTSDSAWKKLNTKTTSSINGMAKNSDGEVIAFGMDGVILSISKDDQVVFNQRTDRKPIAAAVGSEGGFIIAGESGLSRVYANGQDMK